MPPRVILLLFLLNLAWALNVVLSKVAVEDLGMPPIFLAAVRSAIVMLALLPLLRPLPKRLPMVLAVGLAITGGSFGLLFVGLQTASPSSAGIVSLLGAPATVFFAILILGERIKWFRAGGIALTLVGVAIAVSSPSGMESLDGLGWIALSALIGAFGAVFVKRLEIDSIRLQAWAAVASVILLAPVSAVTETGQWASLTVDPLGAAGIFLFASIVVSVGANTAYFRLFQRYPAEEVVPFTLLHPLFTVILGIWLTGDPAGPRLLAGGVIALLGVAIIVLRPSQAMSKRFLVRPRL
ncbi:DMT family transporter [Qipengyuania sp. JC766]|uniref:DMT family transporter n=1 Tax=Qipengyuania sp. JC766 TaxID=3232139 RepID=UPI00345970CA